MNWCLHFLRLQSGNSGGVLEGLCQMCRSNRVSSFYQPSNLLLGHIWGFLDQETRSLVHRGAHTTIPFGSERSPPWPWVSAVGLLMPNGVADRHPLQSQCPSHHPSISDLCWQTQQLCTHHQLKRKRVHRKLWGSKSTFFQFDTKSIIPALIARLNLDHRYVEGDERNDKRSQITFLWSHHYNKHS